MRCCQATGAQHAADGGAARKTLAREPLRMRHPVPRCAARRYRCISSSRSARKQNTPASSADGEGALPTRLTSITAEGGTPRSPPATGRQRADAARTRRKEITSAGPQPLLRTGEGEEGGLSLAQLARHTYGQVDTRTDEEILYHCTHTHTFPPPVHSSNSLHASGTNVGYINGTIFKRRNRNWRRLCSRNETDCDSMWAQPNPAISKSVDIWDTGALCTRIVDTRLRWCGPRKVSSCILCTAGCFIK